MTDKDLEDEISEIDEIFSEMFPDIEERRRAMQLLLTSVGIADSVCPDAWSASMFANGFRLNVARVEALVILDRIVRMNLQAQSGAAPFTGPLFEEVSYASQPRPDGGRRAAPALYRATICAEAARPRSSGVGNHSQPLFGNGWHDHTMAARVASAGRSD